MLSNSTRTGNSGIAKRTVALPIHEASKPAIIAISVGCTLALLLMLTVIIAHVVRLRRRLKARRTMGGEKAKETHRNITWRHRLTASDVAAMLPLLKVPQSPMQALSRSPSSVSPHSGCHEPEQDVLGSCMALERKHKPRTLRTSYGFAIFTDETPTSPALPPPPLPPKSPRSIFAKFSKGRQTSSPTIPPTPPPKDLKFDFMTPGGASAALSRTNNQTLPRITIPHNPIERPARVYREGPPVHAVSVPSPVSSEAEGSLQSGLYFELSATSSAASSLSHWDFECDIPVLLPISAEGTEPESSKHIRTREGEGRGHLEAPQHRLTRSTSHPSMHLTVPSVHSTSIVPPLPHIPLSAPRSPRLLSPLGPRAPQTLYRSASLFALKSPKKDGDHRKDSRRVHQSGPATTAAKPDLITKSAHVTPEIVLYVSAEEDRLGQFPSFVRPLPQLPETAKPT